MHMVRKTCILHSSSNRSMPRCAELFTGPDGLRAALVVALASVMVLTRLCVAPLSGPPFLRKLRFCQIVQLHLRWLNGSAPGLPFLSNLRLLAAASLSVHDNENCKTTSNGRRQPAPGRGADACTVPVCPAPYRQDNLNATLAGGGASWPPGMEVPDRRAVRSSLCARDLRKNKQGLPRPADPGVDVLHVVHEPAALELAKPRQIG